MTRCLFSDVNLFLQGKTLQCRHVEITLLIYAVLCSDCTACSYCQAGYRQIRVCEEGLHEHHTDVWKSFAS